MEMWHSSYQDIMSIPTTRRRRLVRKKLDLEDRRRKRQEAEAAKMRSRARR